MRGKFLAFLLAVLMAANGLAPVVLAEQQSGMTEPWGMSTLENTEAATSAAVDSEREKMQTPETVDLVEEFWQESKSRTCKSKSAFSLNEETAAQIGAETFIAYHTINWSAYDYYMNDYKGAYRSVVENRRKDPVWVGLLVSWRVATFNIKSEAEYAQKEIGYYEAFLYDMLYDEESESILTEFTDTYSDALKQFNTSTKSLGTSAWKSVLKLDESLIKSTALPTDPQELAELEKTLGTVAELKDGMKLLGDITKYVGYCKDAVDLVNKLSQVQALVNASNETGAVLLDVASQSEVSGALERCLREYGQIVSGTISEEEALAMFTAQGTIDEAIKMASKDTYKAVLKSANAYGLGIEAGQEVGKLAANTLFNTDKSIANYYELCALYDLETAMQKQVLAYQKDFESNPNENTARIFNASLKMLYKLYLQGLDLYGKFLEVNYRDGSATAVYNSLPEDEYQKMKKSIAGIKQSIRSTMQSERAIALTAYADVLQQMQAPLVVELTPEPVEAKLTAEEQAELLPIIEKELRPYSMNNLSGDITLTEDQVIYGDVWQTGGTLNLNGHTLTIYGNLYQDQGALFINTSCTCIIVGKGILHVTGDYRMQHKYTNNTGETEWELSFANLMMNYPEDKVYVDGNFCETADVGSDLSAGELHIKGNLESNGWLFYNSKDTLDTFCVYLKGEGNRDVYLTNAEARINRLAIEEKSKVTWHGWLNITNWECDAVIETDEVQISKDSNLNGYTITINGDVRQTDGTICLRQGSLTVNADLYQEEWTDIIIDKGTLHVAGDYRMQSRSTNNSGETVWEASWAHLTMKYPEDKVYVDGSFYETACEGSTLEAGELHIKGNVEANNSFFSYSSNTFCVYLEGEGERNVYLLGTKINRLVIGEKTRVTWRGQLNVTNWECDAVIETDEIGISTDSNLNGHTITINGDVWQTRGTIQLQQGNLTVNGDLYQGSTNFNDIYIIVSKGALHVAGDYRMQYKSMNSAGETVWESSYAYLTMNSPEDKVYVDGNFYETASYCSTLSAGELHIKGNMESNGWLFFGSSNTFCVYLEGEGNREVYSDWTTTISRLVIGERTKVTWHGDMNVDNWECDAVIETDEVVIGHSSNLNGHTITINGDVTQSGGTIQLQQGSLTVNGNLYQGGYNLSYCDVIVDKGILHVTGDYRMQYKSMNSAGETVWESSYSHLTMTYPEDKVYVDGNFYETATYSSTLNAGELHIKGNVEANGQFFGSAKDTHRTVLDGTKLQTVTFTSNTQFNILRLTQLRKQYVFTPEPCWKTLEEDYEGEDSKLPGDVNGDNKVGAQDLTLLCRYLLDGENSGGNVAAADMNADNRINMQDLTLLCRVILEQAY